MKTSRVADYIDHMLEAAGLAGYGLGSDSNRIARPDQATAVDSATALSFRGSAVSLRMLDDCHRHP